MPTRFNVRSARTISLYILILSVLLISCSSQDSNSRNGSTSSILSRTSKSLVVKLATVAVIGESSSEHLLGSPILIATDDQGRIYVADEASMEISVFNKETQYLGSLGARGRGPGEFLSFNGLYVNSRDEVIVYDQVNRRLTFFPTDSDSFETIPLAVGATIELDDFKENYIASYYESTIFDTTQESLLHIYDKDFNLIASELPLKKTLSDNSVIAGFFFRDFPGDVATHEGTVFYSPSLYSGHIYRFENITSDSPEPSILQGYTVMEPYSLVETEPKDTDHADMVTSTSTGRTYAARLHNRSRGLFRLSDGRLVHFTFLEKKDQRIFGVETFNSDGQLVDYTPLKHVPLTDLGIANLRWNVVHKDEEDRFYFIDKETAPVVRIVELVYTSPIVISGIVQYHNDQVLDSARVTLIRQTENIASVAAPDGNFSFNVEEPGGYFLWFEAPGYVPAAVPIVACQEQPVRLWVKLKTTPDRAVVSFEDSNSVSARIATIFQRRNTRPETSLLLAKIDRADSRLVKHFLMLTHFSHLPDSLEKKMARRILREIPSSSPVWSLQWGSIGPTNTFAAVSRAADQPTVSHTYAVGIRENHPNPSVRAAFLYRSLMHAHKAGDMEQARAYYARLEKQYGYLPDYVQWAEERLFPPADN